MNYNSQADVDNEHPLHLSSHSHQYNTPQSTNGASFATTFRHMDHAMDSGASRNMHPSASPHLLAHDGNGNMHQSHIQQNYTYADARNAIATPSTPSQSASPRFSAISPGQNRQMYQAYVPQDRSLPDTDVTDDSIDDAYTAFVLYCNPSFAISIDTAELRKVFRTPPKSDGKSFSTYTLFELLRKLDAKEIKTWTELALELGVEKPAMEKGQSSQKVQQYSVRLKRWMRALHIDAFFEYLMGKAHTYYQQIPPLSDPFPESRDGVPIEEDLAVRALDPKFRPKRGRKRADDHDDDIEPSSAIDPKRPQLDTSISFSHQNGYPQSACPASAIPMSAHPDDMDRFVNGDPWSAIPTPAGGVSGRGPATSQQLRWRNETPSTPHPLSAITPMSDFDEPQSAVTPSSRNRQRRRHGPAVSSAWPSTNTTANGKLRGRPPSNRSVRDGPFVTFPANPKTKEGPTIDLSRNHITTTSDPAASTPATSESPNPQFRVPQQPTPMSATSDQTRPSPTGRPERLQLQVPQHVGNPVVRLVTPTLLVNGQMNDSVPQSAMSQTMSTPGLSTASTARTTASSFFGPPGEGSTATEMDEHSDGAGLSFHHMTSKNSAQSQHNGIRGGSMLHSATPFSASPFFSNEDLKRALAADLLRAEIEGRPKRLRGSEAKELAEALLSRLRPRLHSAVSDPGGASGLGSEDIFRLTCASWLGLNIPLGLSSAGVQSTGAGKKISTRRFRVGGDGYDSPLDEDDAVGLGEEIRETFDVSWTLTLGDCAGKFSFKGLILGARDSWDAAGPGDDEDTSAGAEAGGRWKEKYLLSEKKIREQEEEIRRLRDKVLDAIL